MSEWLRSIDRQDPGLDLSNPDPFRNFSQLEEDEGMHQQENGVVLDVRSGKALGKISDSLSSLPGATANVLAVTCYLHNNCRTIKSEKQLPWNADARIRHWLRWGQKNLPNRDDGAKHQRKLLRICFALLNAGGRFCM